jgi:hypothetical protein
MRPFIKGGDVLVRLPFRNKSPRVGKVAALREDHPLWPKLGDCPNEVKAGIASRPVEASAEIVADMRDWQTVCITCRPAMTVISCLHRLSSSEGRRSPFRKGGFRGIFGQASRIAYHAHCACETGLLSDEIRSMGRRKLGSRFEK